MRYICEIEKIRVTIVFYNNSMDKWSGDYNGKQLRASGRTLGIVHQQNRTQSRLLYACVLSPDPIAIVFFYDFRVKQVLDFQIPLLSPADRCYSGCSGR